ncbi:hypothetical protein IC762_30210 [Bradyrhizobium genosp. L]|uniref:hypothetical protein n=1 Tax=Bradyrhizobium genosp. L TaxID=83637 RepID=UPI0018A29716|nr:hypothetical protein [Bradyrhizobium genosp. L]QPF83893.1 hypothetical protein IC762_30210 [Bradyrhizobium genosp. L]
MMIFDAAEQGHTSRRVGMPSNLDERCTGAASVLEKWCKNEGLSLIREKRTVDSEDGRRIEVSEPEISWQPKA